MSKECGCESDHECECGCDCGCGGYEYPSFQRRYQTKAEQIADLESYLSELKTEMQAVEEHLADLRK
jgi:hypothetical protein